MAIFTLSAIDLDLPRPNISLINAATESAGPGAFLAVECGGFRREET